MLLPPALALLALTMVAVGAIVVDHRTTLEQYLRDRYGIDRDWWVPPLVLAVAAVLSLISLEAAQTAVREKADIIALILTFGLLAEGLGASGFFRYVAHRVVDRCAGDTTRLVVSMFLATSLVTVVTSNDIVVLVMTPIIVGICFQSAIQNTRLLLLTQFIAANTLSMGVLIGSPTNLIIADELGLNFFEYTLLMGLPTLIAFLASYALVRRTPLIAKSDRIPGFQFLAMQNRYETPERNPEPTITPAMRNWVLLFGTVVALVAVATYLHLSLLWCAVPGFTLALVYWAHSVPEPVTAPLTRLPYGIVFFGFTFFIFAEAFSRTPFMATQLVPLLEGAVGGNPRLVSLGGVIASGGLVNLFNDLPAAALIAQVLGQVQFESTATELVLAQASLVGVNIGTYVTQVGALAGLLWFNQIRIERQQLRKTNPTREATMQFPTRLDLLRYGGLHFVTATMATGLFLFGEWLVLVRLLG